ncbi:hypothetical protein GCM10027446_15510 [Angustibacter peucedani]
MTNPALPAELAATVADLRSPDPAVRDAGAYSTLARVIGEGGADGHLAALLDAAADLYRDPEVPGRAFAPLLVALVVGHDDDTHELERADVDRAVEALLAWWLTEDEVQGHDPERGWLHALAHGSDAVDELGVSRHGDSAMVNRLLDTVIARLFRPTDYRFVQTEETRIAYALARLLSSPVISDDDRARVVDALAAAWRTAPPGPVEPVTFNVVATATALHLHLSLGIEDVDPPADLLPRLSDALRELWPWSTPAAGSSSGSGSSSGTAEA